MQASSAKQIAQTLPLATSSKLYKFIITIPELLMAINLTEFLSTGRELSGPLSRLYRESAKQIGRLSDNYKSQAHG